MFWRKKEERGKKKAAKKIEGALWGYMVSQHNVIVDILQNLRRVERDAVVKGKPATMIRIFNPALTDEKGVPIDMAIKTYESLDDHPELILYEGYCREISGLATDIHIERR